MTGLAVQHPTVPSDYATLCLHIPTESLQDETPDSGIACLALSGPKLTAEGIASVLDDDTASTADFGPASSITSLDAASTDEDDDLPPVPANAPEKTVIFFDWDDTLFPSHFILNVVLPWMEENAHIPLEETQFFDVLSKHGKLIEDTLYLSRSFGRVCIVTLAKECWFDECVLKFLPGLDLSALLADLEIPVVFARTHVKRYNSRAARFGDGTDFLSLAKQHAMGDALNWCASKGCMWTNVLSVGDSDIERNALVDLIWAQEHEAQWPAFCKTVKFVRRPGAELLGSELCLLSKSLHVIVSRFADLDIKFDDEPLSTLLT